MSLHPFHSIFTHTAHTFVLYKKSQTLVGVDQHLPITIENNVCVCVCIWFYLYFCFFCRGGQFKKKNMKIPKSVIFEIVGFFFFGWKTNNFDFFFILMWSFYTIWDEEHILIFYILLGCIERYVWWVICAPTIYIYKVCKSIDGWVQ